LYFLFHFFYFFVLSFSNHVDFGNGRFGWNKNEGGNNIICLRKILQIPFCPLRIHLFGITTWAILEKDIDIGCQDHNGTIW
jgi:hypothetical protein